MSELTRPGDFCPNSECDDYGELQGEDQTNIVKLGKTKAGHQRYRCKTCRRTFVETTGTIFYRRRTPRDKIIDTLTLVAEDSRISSLARAKGHKEETIISHLQLLSFHVLPDQPPRLPEGFGLPASPPNGGLRCGAATSRREP